MKIVFVIFYLFFTLLSFAQKKNTTIGWSNTVNLNWSDFKGKPNKANSFKALTSTSISFGVNYENSTVNIEIKTEFESERSWTKVKETGNLLNHERLHFDISELFARRLRQKILTTSFKSRDQKLINEVSSLYQETMREQAKYQRAYDKETNHSIIKDAQHKWEVKIKEELDALSEYSATDIQLQLD